ncbi:MAG: ribosomal-protein-alanine N-acetyltransferase [Pseudobutyrivibrio sp.]|jgi:ribosomal-protein-alanine N-acetyltransferase|uniref:ribosomal protein S18-alanine N-acetyltransferase n=1 Tax=Pseudobutyrivibrio sp. TaxID=2014367 RepID=UPI0026004E35|nr:ribosomal protein S18-alanine N-acetyltransferase [Pseudobutyrivibrio sp.]MBE5903824.1 ribosomal-protein-alanine N-acetyltransferase [Pseudobutyrivibrio sp.]
MSIEFRFANDRDLDTIVEIESSSMSCPWSRDSYKEAMDSDHAFIMVATESDSCVGFAVFYLTVPESELPDIVVAEEHRGKGIGKALLDASLRELTSRGVDTVFLEVRVSNERAKALYEKVGFEEIGRRKYFYSDPVEDAICMRLEMN